MIEHLTSKPIRIDPEHGGPEVYFLHQFNDTFVFGNIERNDGKEFLSIYEMDVKDFSVEDRGSYIEVTPLHMYPNSRNVNDPCITSTGRRMIGALRILQELAENE